MASYERKETYVSTISFLDDSGTLYYPTSVKLTLTSPCGTVLVDEQSMTSNAAGEYSYNYQLLDSAIYGEYSTSIAAEYSSATSIDTDKFFVMPWNIVDEVRTYSQQCTKKISDDDLSLIAWNAFQEVSHKVSEFHSMNDYVDVLMGYVNVIQVQSVHVDVVACHQYVVTDTNLTIHQ